MDQPVRFFLCDHGHLNIRDWSKFMKCSRVLGRTPYNDPICCNGDVREVLDEALHAAYRLGGREAALALAEGIS